MANKQPSKKPQRPVGPDDLVTTVERVTMLNNTSQRPILVEQSFPKELGRRTETHRLEAGTTQVVDFVDGHILKATFAD